jgi:hypothetical protein
MVNILGKFYDDNLGFWKYIFTLKLESQEEENKEKTEILKIKVIYLCVPL